MYVIGNTYEPFDQSDLQDMYIAEIDYVKDDRNDPMINHRGVVEVRAESKGLLRARISVILTALNQSRSA